MRLNQHAYLPTRCRRSSPGRAAGVVRACVEAVEPRLFLAANPMLPTHADALTRVNAKLLELHDDVVAGKDAREEAKADRLRVDAQQRVEVTVKADDVNAA